MVVGYYSIMGFWLNMYVDMNCEKGISMIKDDNTDDVPGKD